MGKRVRNGHGPGAVSVVAVPSTFAVPSRCIATGRKRSRLHTRLGAGSGAGSGAGAGSGSELGGDGGGDDGAEPSWTEHHVATLARREGMGMLADMARRASDTNGLHDVDVLGPALFQHLTLCARIGEVLIPLRCVGACKRQPLVATTGSKRVARATGCVRTVQLWGLDHHVARPVEVAAPARSCRRNLRPRAASTPWGTGGHSEAPKVCIGVVVPDAGAECRHLFVPMTDTVIATPAWRADVEAGTKDGTAWNLSAVGQAWDIRACKSAFRVYISSWRSMTKQLCLALSRAIANDGNTSFTALYSTVRNGHECYALLP